MRKTWKLEDKLRILESGKSGNIVSLCRKEGLSTATYYEWKKQYEVQGEQGLKGTYQRKDPNLRKAEEEIRILRKLLADKEIELEVQRELLKKKFGTDDPKKI